MGGDSAVVQASLLASLTAASVSPSKWLLIGVPFTAISSYFGAVWAVAAAGIHVLIVLSLNKVSPFPISAIMAGLLSGCVITYQTATATIFGALLVTAILTTAIENQWDLWVVALPAVFAGVIIGGVLFFLASRRKVRKSKTSNNLASVEAMDYSANYLIKSKSIELNAPARNLFV